MRPAVLLLFGVYYTYAGTHSLRYVYTAVSGDIDFPEFTAVGLLDDQQFMYFDSNTKKTVPKIEFMRKNEGKDYWDRETQIDIGTHQSFKVIIQTLKGLFNQTGGVHTYQRMYGCEFNDQTGETNAFKQDGCNGEDFLTLELKEMRYISPVQEGFLTVQKWNNDRYGLEKDKNYFSTECFEWLKKYLQNGKSSLEKTVSPQVSLLQKSPSSPVSCHATGFYPKEVSISWQKNKQDVDEDVDLGELLLNEDGSFQKTSTLNVKPEEWQKNEYECVVEHKSRTIRSVLKGDKIRTNSGSVPIGLIVGVVAALLLLVILGVAGFMVYQKKKGFKPVASDDGSNSSTRSDQKA
ncbi:BOLA class I histocompatibility antigen, alpha chain BL3-7-like [Puntigrus tetrazona]|uniref:BOLA class I histocompatibility antigen, alpha chain BL3-7-like n=1 Tax=Puntigrus tetrazona TaxID=1606681 RepID=UPI001C891F46|nr:BOLA class I histocompatibility antigen, alpha chain BL3-7-like [Puntigrus tetrazona]